MCGSTNLLVSFLLLLKCLKHNVPFAYLNSGHKLVQCKNGNSMKKINDVPVPWWMEVSHLLRHKLLIRNIYKMLNHCIPFWMSFKWNFLWQILFNEKLFLQLNRRSRGKCYEVSLLYAFVYEYDDWNCDTNTHTQRLWQAKIEIITQPVSVFHFQSNTVRYLITYYAFQAERKHTTSELSKEKSI